MGKALVAACLLFAACQPMYEKRPERLKAPPPARNRGPVVVVDPEPTPVDTCTVNFSAPPTKKRSRGPSAQLTVQGTASLSHAANQPRTAAPAVIGAQDAIEKFRQALIADPYNAEATLMLALAYDRVLRKGCALAMLRRLETLASNPAFQSEATPMKQQVQQNPHWFRPYHSDALKAVGY